MYPHPDRPSTAPTTRQRRRRVGLGVVALGAAMLVGACSSQSGGTPSGTTVATGQSNPDGQRTSNGDASTGGMTPSSLESPSAGASNSEENKPATNTGTVSPNRPQPPGAPADSDSPVTQPAVTTAP